MQALPAFRSYVPRYVRIFLLLAFSIVFQFSGTVYLNLTGNIAGAMQMLRENLTFLFQMTMAGITLVYPLLFRLKLRFTSQQIVIGCALVTAAMILVTLCTESIALLAVASLILGAAKMLGTFEALVSLQLIITPNRDYGVFFSVALGLVLLCGQISGIWAVHLAYESDWTAIYRIMVAANVVMATVAMVVMRHVRVAKMLPLYGIDWTGAFLWGGMLVSVTYIFSYGQVLDWWDSTRIQAATVMATVLTLLAVARMLVNRRPYISPHAFTIRSVNTAILIILVLQPFLSASGSVLGPFTSGILRMDDINIANLNWPICYGLAFGAVFSYYWFLKVSGSFKVFFITGFASLTGYYALVYFVLGGYGEASVLWLPYFLRGFGHILVFVGVGKYITRGVPFEIFTQVLCYLAMARNSIGSLIPASLISYAQYIRTADFHTKLASRIDEINPGASSLYQKTIAKSLHSGFGTTDAAASAGKALFIKVNQQAVLLAGKESFGLMASRGILIIVGLAAMHFSRPFISKLPSWQNVRRILQK